MGKWKGKCAEEVEYNAEVGRRIELLRAANCTPHWELAMVAGVTIKALGSYEAGLARWPVFRVRLIADHFHVPVGQLVPKMLDNVVSSCKNRSNP